MSQYLSLKPAYGRRYAIARAALADWNLGKDFKIVNGPYCSKRDIAEMLKEGYAGVALFSDQGYVAVDFFSTSLKAAA